MYLNSITQRVAQKENERALCCYLANVFKVCSQYTVDELLATPVVHCEVAQTL